jgi:hypothetical protein
VEVNLCRFLLIVYISISIGDLIIKRGDVDPVNWFNAATLYVMAFFVFNLFR